MTNLEKAREWANQVEHLRPLSEEAEATAKLIQSLPDQWVDADEVRLLAKDLKEKAINGQDGFYSMCIELSRMVEDLLHPRLPNLAELLESGHKAEEFKFMQCKVRPWGDNIGVLFSIGEKRTEVLLEAAASGHIWNVDITPLPDLPKLEWPSETPRKPYLFGGTSGESDLPMTGILESPVVADDGSIHTPMQPSEVPANEPWLIEVCDQKAIGTRYAGNAVRAWAVAALDGSFANDYKDSEVTLIHKLVAEPPALPEGVGLADHKEYGRVIASLKADPEEDHLVMFEDKSSRWGDVDWAYLNESELTFLDDNNLEGEK